MSLIRSVILPANPSPLVKIALDFAEGMTEAKFDLIESTLAEDYHHSYLPENGEFPVYAGRDKYVGHEKTVLPHFGKIKADIRELVEAPETVVLQLNFSGMTTFGIPYASDVIYILHAAQQPDGTVKFVRGKEFVNTKLNSELRKGLREYNEKQAAAEAD